MYLKQHPLPPWIQQKMAAAHKLCVHEGHEGKRKTRYEVNDIREFKILQVLAIQSLKAHKM
jgi:hypothetical protein